MQQVLEHTSTGAGLELGFGEMCYFVTAGCFHIISRTVPKELF